MQTFRQYSDSFKLNCDREILDFCSKDQDYCIFEGSKLLQTQGGNNYSHSSETLIRQLVTDMQLFSDETIKDFSSPLLFSFWKDTLINGEDPFLEQWDNHLACDPFVLIKTEGKTTIQPFSPDDPLFTFAFVSLTGLLEVVNNFSAKIMGEISVEENDFHPFPELLHNIYKRLTTYQKAAVNALNSIHNSGIVLPLLLVSGEINALEYAKGLISLKIQHKKLLSEMLASVVKVQAYLNIFSQNKHHDRPTVELIKDGEGALIEFKSTLRWDIRAGKTNPAIERSCLKTISAFLNSKGGTLLIGVRDDGSIEGIETDKFANEDKFLLHLWTLIRLCLGRDFSPFITTKLEKMDEKTICVVGCHPSDRPVFLRQSGFDEEMYIRLGPSSNAMNISEALNYIENHFH